MVGHQVDPRQDRHLARPGVLHLQVGHRHHLVLRQQPGQRGRTQPRVHRHTEQEPAVAVDQHERHHGQHQAHQDRSDRVRHRRARQLVQARRRRRRSAVRSAPRRPRRRRHATSGRRSPARAPAGRGPPAPPRLAPAGPTARTRCPPARTRCPAPRTRRGSPAPAPACELGDAVLDRDRRADREEADRGEQRPHVRLAAVARRVLLVGGPLRAPLRDRAGRSRFRCPPTSAPPRRPSTPNR